MYNETFYQNTGKAAKNINRKWKKFKISVRYSKRGFHEEKCYTDQEAILFRSETFYGS